MSSVKHNRAYRGALKSDILKAADTKARRNFVYVLDRGDQWRSFADVALSGESWRGDCDDLTSTTLHIAIQLGTKKNQLWMGVVATRNDGKADHLVGLAKDEKGKWWVIGDTHRPTYSLALMEHELLEVHNLAWPIDSWEHMTVFRMLQN